MSNYPDFSSQGYQVIRELGRNREAGRITYQATSTSPTSNPPLPPRTSGMTGGVQVVIKEFRFADAGADWSRFKAYQREIEVLQQLNHPRIPKYKDCFETPQGFCLVQEYKNAPSLSERHNFKPEDIKQIALSLLEILVYLQQRTPAIVHRDIKPENILVDEQLNAYLVDFGLARIRGGEVAISSVAAGTPGFIPPEEQFGRPLTSSSDLYSVGATLICLLTGTRSVDLGKLIDDNYRFDFKHKVPQLSRRFVDWLTKMVEPNIKKRFANAAVALQALKPIDVVGSGRGLETLVRAIQPGTGGPLVGLAFLCFLTLFCTTLIISRQDTLVRHQQDSSVNRQKNSSVKQLLSTNSCERCDLGEAGLESANLKGANLRRANLRHANLMSANLMYASLGGANLFSADLVSADLGRANLGAANLMYAKLERANLEVANLMYANVINADLAGANLKDANLVSADLRYVNLEGANLKDANLGGADLGSADLRYANLSGANLSGANLKSANLKGAIMPDGTKHQ